MAEHGFAKIYRYNSKYNKPKFKNKKILDLGCGDGVMLKYLHDKYKTISYGVDISKLNIYLCKQKLPKDNFYCQDIIKYLQQCDDESFDFIISYGGIGMF